MEFTNLRVIVARSTASDNDGASVRAGNGVVNVAAASAWPDSLRSVDALNERTVLHDVSGAFPSASLIAVMGSSGAGKSTLLNSLANRLYGGIAAYGAVAFNGTATDEKWCRRHTAFVPQDSALLPALTPREAIQFAADLRLSHVLTYEQRKQRTENVLRDCTCTSARTQLTCECWRAVSLLKCADTRIGDEHVRGVSGGERKRTAIGVELVTNPPILYLDEPTSGLDSFTSHSVMQSVKQITKSNKRTVVCTIHQPTSEIYALFDHLVLLSAGHIVYSGPAAKAVKFFESRGQLCPPHTAPAEFFLDQIQCRAASDVQRVAKLVVAYRAQFATERKLVAESNVAESPNEQPPAVEPAPVPIELESGGREGSRPRPTAVPASNPNMDFKHSHAPPALPANPLPPAQAAARASNATPPVAVNAASWQSPPSSAVSKSPDDGEVEGKQSIGGESKAVVERMESVRSNSGTAGSLSISHESSEYKLVSQNSKTVEPVATNAPNRATEIKPPIPAAGANFNENGFAQKLAKDGMGGPTAGGKISTDSGGRAIWIVQLKYLFIRSALTLLRTPLLTWAKVLLVVIMGLLTGLTFMGLTNDQYSIQNRFGAIYFILISVMFGNSLAVVLTFANERAVFLREQSNHMYAVSAYFLGKSFVDLPVECAVIITYAAISYFLIGFAASFNQFVTFTGILILVAFAGQSIGLVVGSAVPGRSLAATLAPLSIAPFILFTPYALPPAMIPWYLQPAKVLSPFWWSFQALATNEFQSLQLRCTIDQLLLAPPIAGDWDADVAEVTCRYLRGSDVLKANHIDPGQYGLNILMLFVISVVFRAAAMVCLKLVSTRNVITPIRPSA